jgi:alpha-ketoglutarate-dependent taurine dioxygenase
MTGEPSRGAPAFKAGFRPGGRKAVRLSTDDLVTAGPMPDGTTFPLLVEPRVADLNPITWAGDRRALIESWLLAHGAVLLRGFAVASAEQFREVARTVTPGLLDYQERAAPRVEVAKNVFTSTEYPADQAIPLHHEMSYSHNWPEKIWFFCLEPAREGGATPIVDDRRLFPRIDPEIKRRFLEKKVMYVRNYGGGVDLPWQEVFQTSDRAEVEAYCAKARMTCEWRGDDRLRTRGVRQVVATHPQTGDTVWFNHAHMFHVSNLTPEVRTALLAEFDEDELPRNAFYGDGSPIEDAVLAAIRGLYSELAVTFPWQQGDLLLLDNFLSSHGREPFAGPRRIVVAMADLYTDPEHGTAAEPALESR